MPPTKKVFKLSSVTAALADVKRGRPVIVVDDASRENEGDIMLAASQVTPAWINFMIKQAGGLVCVALPGERLQALELPPMVAINTDPYGTDFAVSVNARFGVSTGVSAADRATTIKTLINPATTPYDLVRPGHVFPLRAKPGGVLQRAGHTEATVDLARLAGLTPAGVTCEMISPTGAMARLPYLQRFAQNHHFKIVSIADLIAYRQQRDAIIERQATATIPTQSGRWTITVFKSLVDQAEQVALIKGDILAEKNPLVRVHSECLTGDVFGSQRCDCGEQLQQAMDVITKAGSGIILYLRQEGRGIGLINKLHAYQLQDAGLDTVQANIKLGFAPDLRDYGVAAQMLQHLGLRSIRLLTNNPKKISGLMEYGLKVVQQVPLRVTPSPYNKGYLQTKKKKFGHLL